MLEQPLKLAYKNSIISGFLYGLSQYLFLILLLIFYISSHFVQNNGVSVENMFVAIFSVLFSGLTVGNHLHILPNLGDCKISAANLFVILDTKDEDEIQIEQNSKLMKTKISGDILLRDIRFKYETRSEYLFDGFNLTIPYGEKVAFVGASGCGKSTILAFLLRFYEP